jgi:hypothetical protein
MGKVFIFGMGGLIVIGLIVLGVFLISGSMKLSSLMWRSRKKESIEERSDKNDQGPHGPVTGSGGSGWV